MRTSFDSAAITLVGRAVLCTPKARRARSGAPYLCVIRNVLR